LKLSSDREGLKKKKKTCWGGSRKGRPGRKGGKSIKKREGKSGSKVFRTSNPTGFKINFTFGQP